MSRGSIHIGTSGWNYTHWRGRFYPKEMPQRLWLEYYARHFRTVEVNGSFYRIPKTESVEHWVEQAPSRFRFALKLWRGITHFKKLKNCREALKSFFEAAEALPVRQRGPVLVQLPKNQGADPEKLDAFLDDLKQVAAPSRWKVAVEFRHPGWLTDETHAVLNRQRAALCLHDMKGQAPAAEPNDASFVYLRRHGASGTYAGRYSAAQIRADAQRVRRWSKAGRTVFISYNNDAEGAAVENALELRRLLKGWGSDLC